jgi:drug/metabolite transporter (DMT)-like permease
MLWAVLYGWWIWGELPDQRTWIGASIIIVAGLFVIFRETRAARRRRRELGTDAPG